MAFGVAVKLDELCQLAAGGFTACTQTGLAPKASEGEVTGGGSLKAGRLLLAYANPDPAAEAEAVLVTAFDTLSPVLPPSDLSSAPCVEADTEPGP